MDTTALTRQENDRWSRAVISPGKKDAFMLVGTKLVRPSAKLIYQQVELATKVPWWNVAVIHEMEAGGNFSRQLGQGDPLGAKSVHVPKNRGPFKTFFDGAVDALVNCAPKAARWTDWSVGGTLTIDVEYNGIGYFLKGVPSPYIWAGTNQYVKGKYVADGVYDPEAVSTQLGIAGLLLAMMELDPSIKFGAQIVTPTTARVSPTRPAVPVTVPAHAAPPQGPSIINPAQGSIGDAVAKIFSALFSHLHS
jgi:lysozyme family protein